MGEIFLAWDDRLGRRVAIKRLRPDSGDPAGRERLRREARAAAGLSHPALVQVYDLVLDPADPEITAVVLEYVEGRTLAELLAGGPCPPGLAVRLGQEIAEGLAAAHAAGLVHRDLKAENVILTPSGHAKVLDFGLACPAEPGPAEAERLTGRGVLVGTYHAMSPEQASGAELDGRSDLFSLGSLLYELLTGRPPFRGLHPADTLRRVIAVEPVPLAELRPDLPPGLGALVGRLLAKDPAARPAGAAAVARELAALGERPELASREDEGWGAGLWSELPTAGPGLPTPTERLGPIVAPLAPPSPLSSAAGRGSSQRGTWGSFLPRYRLLPVAGGVAVLAGLGLLGGLALRYHVQPPRRVVVVRPEIVEATAGTPESRERLSLAASGVLVASLAGLTSLEGLAPLDPSQAGIAGSTGSTGAATAPAAAARTAAADEVLSSTLERAEGELAQLTLRRVAADGQVLWAEGFAVPTAPGDLHLLADAVAVHLERAYPEARRRAGTPDLDVRDEDYAAFLDVRRRIDAGRSPLAPELVRLEEIVRRSPRFLEAQLQAAHCAYSLYQSKRVPDFLARGSRFVAAARVLAPNDPRPLAELFRLALASGRPAEAEKALADLGHLQPADPELRVLRSVLAESRGLLDEAIAEQSAAVTQVPSWKNLYRLADLTARSGRIAAARGHFQALLARSPGNLWAREKLAEMELLYGDLSRAEQLYLDLLATSKQRSYWTNLGLSRFLLGRPAAAVEAYHQALAFDPGHVYVRLNLADALLALGREGEAKDLYARVLAALESNRVAAPPSPVDEMTRAQCLIHLDRTREAVELTQKTLQASPGDSQVVYLAALVYALAGDRASALVNAVAALDKGVQPRWFRLAAFAPLVSDAELAARLAGHGGKATR